jgi:peroxiredoxin
MLKFVLCAVAALVTVTTAQTDVYQKALFNRGCPEILKGFKWQDALWAEVAPDTFFQQLLIVYKSPEDFPERAALVIVEDSSGFGLRSCAFIQKANNHYEAIVTLSNRTEDQLTPLQMILDTTARELRYRWINSKTNKPFIAKPYPLKPGSKFPDLTVETEQGKINLADYRGKVVVLNYWATTCAPCIAEMPGLNQLVKKYRTKDVLFLAILDDPENLAAFKKKHAFDYLQGFSNDDIENLLGKTFPRNIIIDRNGVILYNHTGGSQNTADDLDAVLQRLF